MSHYICTGSCCGVSETPGVCQSDSCSQEGRELEKCQCQDGKHFGKQIHQHDHGKNPEKEGE